MASEPARDFLQHLADSVACPVCYRIYDKPKSLPCGHTFCFECIQCVADGNSYEDEDDDYYYPVCRETEVGAFSPRELCVSAVFAVARCPSVCQSVMLVYCIRTAEDIVKLLSRPDSPVILVF